MGFQSPTANSREANSQITTVLPASRSLACVELARQRLPRGESAGVVLRDDVDAAPERQGKVRTEPRGRPPSPWARAEKMLVKLSPSRQHIRAGHRLPGHLSRRVLDARSRARGEQPFANRGA